MKEFYKELSKHYLGIAAALLITLLVGVFFTDVKFNFMKVIIGIISYVALLGISRWLFIRSNKYGESNNV